MPCGRVLALLGNDERLARGRTERLVGDLRLGRERHRRNTGHLEVGLGGVLHLVLDPATGRVEQRLLVVAPDRLRLLELGAGAAGDEHLLLDHGLHDLDDALDRRVRPAALLQVPQRDPDLVAALLDRRVDQERPVVGRRFLAVDEEVLALLLRRRAEVERLVPRLRRGPAVRLEQRLGVPDAVHRHHVVERDELVLERAGVLDAGVDDVGDLLALVGVGLEDVVELLELVENAQEADLVLTGVVDEVRRVATDEAGLELRADVDDRLDVDLGAA